MYSIIRGVFFISVGHGWWEFRSSNELGGNLLLALILNVLSVACEIDFIGLIRGKSPSCAKHSHISTPLWIPKFFYSGQPERLSFVFFLSLVKCDGLLSSNYRIHLLFINKGIRNIPKGISRVFLKWCRILIDF